MCHEKCAGHVTKAAVPRLAMLCHAILRCRAMICHDVPCYAILYCAMQCYEPMQCYAVTCCYGNFPGQCGDGSLGNVGLAMVG